MKRLFFYTYLLFIIYGFVAANVINYHYDSYPSTNVLPAVFLKQSIMKCQQSIRHINLFKYSCNQLKNFFSYHNYSEKNVLDQNMLYLSDEFVKLAKTYSGYELAIVTLRKKMCEMSSFGKWWREYITGSYSPKLEDRINQLYDEMHHAQKPSAITLQVSHQDVYEYKRMFLRNKWMQYTVISCDQKVKNRLNKRIHALDQHYITSYGYLKKDICIFAQKYYIDLYELAPNNDLAIAHVLYQEYLDILDATAHILVQNTDILCDAIGQASHIGLEANKAGFVEQSSKLADFCWAILDYVQAVGEGIYLGASNTLHTLVNPVEIVKNALIGIGVITYGLVSLTDFMQQTSFLYCIDNDQFFLRFNAIQNALQNIANIATSYLTTNRPREIVKDSAAFVTEGFLFGKIVRFAANITRQILPLTMYYAEYIATKEPLACFIDGESVYLIPKEAELSNIFLSSIKQGEVVWISKGGLIYGPDRKFGSRVAHVLQHMMPNDTKLHHSVFAVSENEIFDLIDFAWSQKTVPLSNDLGTYIVDLKKIIGTLGETAIKIVTVPGTNQIITAYPIKV